MPELLFKDEVYNIVGAAMEVHNMLGSGFLEAVYQEALAIEFRLRGIPFTEQLLLQLEFKGHPLKCKYVPDYLCYEEIIVEIKALKQCGPNEEAQIINALKAAKKRVGVLINFGEQSLYWKRYVN
ncbi:MAG: GxxExxY protein [bacterium]|nr:GxxExxY protein [bacterium]